MTRNCRVCGVELNGENWYPASKKNRNYICKKCNGEKGRVYREENQEKENEYQRLYRKNNPEKAKASNTKQRRKNGGLSMSENKECSAYIGVYVNERLLKHYFNDVEVMPYGHSNYDFVCNNGWKIDAKSSATGDKGYWAFGIKHNTTADYFFCVAYNNRKDKNIIHIWLLPGNKFNHLSGAQISKSTVDRWAEYEQPLDKLITCCDSMKNGDI